jgi:hypothetical protein
MVTAVEATMMDTVDSTTAASAAAAAEAAEEGGLRQQILVCLPVPALLSTFMLTLLKIFSPFSYSLQF